VADFSEAIRIAPLGTQPLENRGDVYLRLKRPADAIADYADLIKRTLKLAAASGPDIQPGAKLARVYRKRSPALLAGCAAPIPRDASPNSPDARGPVRRRGSAASRRLTARVRAG
jgi:hypothetical protein